MRNSSKMFKVNYADPAPESLIDEVIQTRDQTSREPQRNEFERYLKIC